MLCSKQMSFRWSKEVEQIVSQSVVSVPSPPGKRVTLKGAPDTFTTRSVPNLPQDFEYSRTFEIVSNRESQGHRRCEIEI